MDTRLDDLQRRLRQLQRKLHAHAPPARGETLAIAAVGALVVGAVAVGAIVLGRRVIERRRRLSIDQQPVLQLSPPAGDQTSSVPPT